MGYALRDAQRYTYADYCTWPEDARYELIDGVAYLCLLYTSDAADE